MAQKPAAREPVSLAQTELTRKSAAAKVKKAQHRKGRACIPKMDVKDMKNTRSLKVRMVPWANGAKSAHQKSCQL